ncbi:MAG: T9SS type A sorting domain-containing protein [Bacteroidales bacterium]
MKKIYILFLFFFIGFSGNSQQSVIPYSQITSNYPTLSNNNFSCGSPEWIEFNGTASFTFDLGKVYTINRIDAWWCLFTLANVKIYTSYSNLGPWNKVFEVNDNNSTLNPSYNFLNKSSRYWKIDIDAGAGSWRRLVEIKFYEIPAITSLNSSVLINGECTTLTSTIAGETYQWSTGETTQSINVCNSGTYSVNVTNTSFTGNQDYTASIAVSRLGSQDNLPGPNGEVYAIYKNSNSVYIGGDFNAFGPNTGNGAQIDTSTAIANTNLPRVVGTINTTISDGNGGWYIGGLFTQVGNYTKINLAHIKSDNTLDTVFRPEPNGAVNTLALYGSSLYLGGSFTTVKTLTNNYAAKIDATTGDPNLWNVNVNGIVNSIQLYADKIIFGGNFTSLGGASRNYLGAVDTVYIQATTWNPNANAAVYKVYVNGIKLYAGGDFTTIGGVSKQYGCGFTLPAFTTDGYNMGANGRINDFILNGTILYAAGSFTVIGGASRNYIAAMNYLNALTNSFNASADGVVNTLAIAGGNLIAGGAFSNIGGAVRNRLAALNLTTGTAAGWNPNVVGLKGTTSNVSCLATQGTNIYAGGSFYSVGASVRNNLAAIDATTGQLTSWDPNVNNIVRAVWADNNYVYLGGDFTTVNSSITKNRIAQLSASTAIATGWNPNADNSVNALTVKGTTLFAGGSFANIGGAARAKIAALSTTSGAATAFNPNANGNVNALCIGGDTVYIGGAFTTIGGQTRNRIASYNITGNTLTAMDPNADNTVNALSFANNKLYIGGSFANVSVKARVNIAEFDVLTNTLTSLNPGAITTTGVNAIFSKDSSLYLGGGYNFPNQGNPINNLGSLNTSGAYIGYWQPQPDNIIRTIFASDNKVYVGGSFKNITSRYQPYFASTDIFLMASPAITSVSPITACENSIITVKGSGFTGVTSVKIGGVSAAYTLVSSDTITFLANASMNGTVAITNALGTVTSTQSISVTAAPAAPSVGTITQPTCVLATGSVVLNGLPSTGNWTINPGNNTGSGTTTTITNLTAATYNYTVTNSSNCTSVASTNVVINAQPSIPTAPTVGTITQTTCASSTGSVILNGLPATGSWTINPGNISGSGTSTTITNLATSTYNYTVTNASSCTSVASANVVINTQPTTPTAPSVGTITQPTCSVATGSVVLNGLPATGSWTINPGNISGSGTTTTISNLTTATYNYTVTNASSCTSVASANVLINAQPSTPSAPTIGTITQPSCSVATGSLVLNALPSTGSWTINPGNISGSGTTTTISNLIAATYNYTVTNASNCSSVTSVNVVINAQPSTPTAPIVGTITQPNCTTATGSVILNGLPASGSWTINPGNISGSGSSTTISNLSAATYNYTVTNASNCTSVASTNVVINAQPSTPTAPTLGTITQPNCITTVGSVVLNGLPASGSWTINPGNISGSGSSTTISNLVAATYNYTVTNASNCTSVATANVVINAQLSTPTAPTVGTITQPNCTTATGSVVLNGLPASGSWTINPGNISGSGSSTTISNLSAATYNYTVTNASNCTSAASANVVINAQPSTPTAPIVGTITQPNCTTATGSVILNGLPASGSWTINPGNISGSGTTKTITGLASATYNYTVTNASNCTSVASANVVINAQPSTPTAPTVGTITQPTCVISTGSVVLNGLPASGSWTINPGNITGSGTTTTISNLTASTYNYTVTNASNCTSVASANVLINTQPSTPTAPSIGTITQPSCTVATGSVVLNGLPSTGSWTINPGSITGSGTSTTISNLSAATYNYTVTNASSCTSSASANVLINTQPLTPTAPSIGTITQPSCTVATGSVVLNGLPASGNWTINPGNISGSGTTTTISNLAAATYNYTVTNASSCTSVASANVVISAQPSTPTAPSIGTITQPSCTVATGSVVLNGLPSSGIWTINPGNITGTGITKTITGLSAATYNYTVTNASSCTSIASANVVINTQPATPTAPTVGTITQPSCTVATGSVVLNGLPSTGSWTINPGNITGSGTTTTISNLVAATYNYTVTNASNCTSSASVNVVINTQPLTPTTPIVGTITQPSCTVATGSVVMNGLPVTGSWTINPGNITGTGITKTITGLSAATYNYTVTNASSCTSIASANVIINVQPVTPTAPTVGTITQPSCTVATGSVVLNDLPATGTWTINPGSITGSGTSKTITGLTTGTYNYTVTNASSCTSVASANVVINAQPSTPTAPIVGTITQPTCVISTGSVVLNGLPASGSWTINPGNISGSGTTTTISSLIAATYNFIVTNASNCTSVASANVVINTQPTTPSAPIVGTITQPTCVTATGSVVLNGLPATGSWTINPGNINGSGTSTTISNLAAANYNYTVTNASNCTSAASANVVINAQPVTPPKPVITLNVNVLQSSAATGNQWYNLSTGLISGATASTYNPVQTASYFTIVTLNGCESDSSNIIYYNYIGINEFSISNNIKVYPNPVHNELILEAKGNTEKLSFEILNVIGQVIFKGKLIEKTIVETSNFIPGVYLIKLENGKTYQFKKIVKE